MVELPMGIVENHLKQIQIAEDWDVMPNPMLIENHLHKSMMFKEKKTFEFEPICVNYTISLQ